MNELTAYLLSVSVLFIGAWFVFRVIVRRDYAQKGSLSLLSSFLELVLCVGFAAVPYLYNPPCWPYVWSCQAEVPPPLAILGYIIIGFGVFLGFGSIIWLGIARSFGRKVTSLYRSGPYRFTRNPQVIGGSLMASGIALLWPSWYALGWIFLWIAMFHLMIITEEEHLLRLYGEDYRGYCEEIPRYLIF